MSQYRQLLLIASESMVRTPAFDLALALAKATKAALHLCSFTNNHALTFVAHIDAAAALLARSGVLQMHKTWLEEEACVLRTQGLQVTTEAVWSQPIDEDIVAHAKELPSDLIIKDVEYASPLKRTLFTPLDWQLLRTCPTRLLLVNSAAHGLPKRIIAAVVPERLEQGVPDFNETLIREALGLALQCEAELHLIHAFDFRPMPDGTISGGALPYSAEIYEEVLQAQKAAFTGLADRFGVPPERRHFLCGQAESVLADFARENATDIIVMGTVHRTGLDRALMGSTAERLLYRAPCSILAIRPQ